MSLSKILSKITHAEILDATKQVKRLSRRGKPSAARARRIMAKYPAAGVILSLPVKRGHELFTKKKLEGYSVACHLISTLAETSANTALQGELATITENEMLSVVEEMREGDKMSFAEWFRAQGPDCYGYVAGMWENFMDLLNSGKNDQSVGFLIVAGGLMLIAKNRDQADANRIDAMSTSKLFAPAFPLGDVVATPGVAALIEKGLLVDLYLTRHHSGDWGSIREADARANTEGVEAGDRLLSAYETPYGRIWIITEADRSSTCVLLPDEY